jgi:IclR family transcriptional regulator, acetate operon repressor
VAKYLPALDSPPGPAAPRPRVQSAARAIGILLAIAQSENGLTTKQISDQVNIGRQATYHLLHTLTSTGMVTRDDGNRYVLGIRVGTLAEGFARQLAPAEHLAPLVRALAQETGETSYASGWWGGEITAMSVARGTNPVQAAEVPQGHVGDAHARASGKLLLARATPAVREGYLAAHPLRKLGPNTITSRAALDRELAEIRDRGYSVDDQEFADGLYCMAIPLDHGYSPFVLAISGPRPRMLEHRERYLATLRRIADQPAAAHDAA